MERDPHRPAGRLCGVPRTRLSRTGGAAAPGVKLPLMNPAASEAPLERRNELTARNFPSAEQDANLKPPPSRYDGP